MAPGGKERRKADRRAADRGNAAVAEMAQSDSRTVILDLERLQSASGRLQTVRRGFLVLVGAEAGEDRLPLVGAKTVVGREGADIVIDDSTLSRCHFEIEARADDYFVRDLDSGNGTFVNNTRIRTSQLTAGDKIRAGNTTFRFSILEVIPVDRPE